MRIDLIYTFFEDLEQEWFETDLPDGALESELKFKQFLNEQLSPSQQAILCKVSCCVIGVTEEMLPEWFLTANGKMWFNDQLREEYNLV